MFSAETTEDEECQFVSAVGMRRKDMGGCTLPKTVSAIQSSGHIKWCQTRGETDDSPVNPKIEHLVHVRMAKECAATSS